MLKLTTGALLLIGLSVVNLFVLGQTVDASMQQPAAAAADAWLWTPTPAVRTAEWVFGRGVHSREHFNGPSWGTQPASCPKPPTFSWFDSADGGLYINCSRASARWAAWPEHRSASGGFLWQPLPAGEPPYRTDAEVVVTRCGVDENWLQRVLPRAAARRRARRLGAARASSSSRRPPDVAVVFVDSVTRHAFVSGAFPRTSRLLRELNMTGDGGGAPASSRTYLFPFYHALPCCTKNWVYAALGGVYAPARNGVHEPALAARTPWVFGESGFAGAGYATHVGNDVCFPSELQDWWRHEDSPMLVNVSDHPAMLDTFCRRKPVEVGNSATDASMRSPASFQSRWDGVQYATRLDDGESICLGGETLSGRWLSYAHDFLTHAGYASTPRFSLTMLNDVHCRCRTGAYHLDIELARFLTKLRPVLHRTVVLLVSDHGLLESFEAPPADLHMPLLALMVPRPLVNAFPAVGDALDANQRRLVTPFDLYHTLLHLPIRLGGRRQQRAARRSSAAKGGAEAEEGGGGTSIDAPTWDDFRSRFEANGASSALPYGPVPRVGPVGQSLLQPLPAERDCEAAGIPRSVCRLERRSTGTARPV